MSPTLLSEERNTASELAALPASPPPPCPPIPRSGILEDLRTSLPLCCADLLAVAVSWSLTMGASWLLGIGGFPGLRSLFGLLATVPAAFLLMELYPAVGLHPSRELKRTTIAVTVLFLGLFSAATLLNDRPVAVFVGRSIQFALLVVLAPTCRHAARAYFRRFDWWRQPLLLIGEREDVELLADRLDRQWYLGLRPVLPGTTNEIPRRVVTTSHSMDAWEDIVWSFPHATFAPRPHLATAASHGDEGGLNTKNRLLIPSHQWLKRIMDLALILAGLPILLPLFLILIVAVKMSSPGPVFYRQARVGRDGRRFHAWKFRTMVHNADEILHDYLSRFPELQAEWKNDHKLKNDPRITPIGSLLRTTSLDELPQLWNVATGEMSLVGPRPIVSEEIVKYGNVFDLYQRVTPGITGLWQVSGRNDTSYAERLELDRYYVRNWSLWLDLFILFRTVRTVLLREGAY